MSKMTLPLEIVTLEYSNGRTLTTLNGRAGLIAELKCVDMEAMNEIVSRVNTMGSVDGNANTNATDTRKTALATVDALTEAFMRDANALPDDAKSSAIRRTAFSSLNSTITSAVLAYWKRTEGTR